jgi:hypothetical protein
VEASKPTIHIFKENQRFSEETSHPGPHSVVGAANPAAAPQAAAGAEPINLSKKDSQDVWESQR